MTIHSNDPVLNRFFVNFHVKASQQQKLPQFIYHKLQFGRISTSGAFDDLKMKSSFVRSQINHWQTWNARQSYICLLNYVLWPLPVRFDRASLIVVHLIYDLCEMYVGWWRQRRHGNHNCLCACMPAFEILCEMTAMCEQNRTIPLANTLLCTDNWTAKRHKLRIILLKIC